MTDWRGVVRPPPLWARWALAIAIAAAVIAGVVIVVEGAGPEGGATSEAQVESEINRIADVSVTEDEAPRSTGLPAGASPATSLERAIGADVRGRIASGQLTGPLQSVACKARMRTGSGRRAYRCTVRSAALTYAFAAVFDERGRRLTWCKVDPSAVGHTGPEIPLSPRCRA